MSKNIKNIEVLHIGDLAKRVGKSVRAIHHYEELGLLEPKQRSKGGFREYDQSALTKIQWIQKLQTIGFSLTEIKGLVEQFSNHQSGPKATDFALSVFVERLKKVRATITELQATEKELNSAIEYLGECSACDLDHAPVDCHGCDSLGRSPQNVPHLFSGLTRSVVGAVSGVGKDKPTFLDLDTAKRKSL